VPYYGLDDGWGNQEHVLTLLGAMRSELEPDHSPLYSAEVKNVCNFTVSPVGYIFMDMKDYRLKFYFTSTLETSACET
jgi:hypothetical protein